MTHPRKTANGPPNRDRKRDPRAATYPTNRQNPRDPQVKATPQATTNHRRDLNTDLSSPNQTPPHPVNADTTGNIARRIPHRPDTPQPAQLRFPPQLHMTTTIHKADDFTAEHAECVGSRWLRTTQSREPLSRPPSARLSQCRNSLTSSNPPTA